MGVDFMQISSLGRVLPFLNATKPQVRQSYQNQMQLQAGADTVLFSGRRKKADDVSGTQFARPFEPIAAVAVDFAKVVYPVIVSPKIDGNRGLVKNGQVIGRSTDPIPNAFVQQLLARPELEGFDGELVASAPNDRDACRKATSFLRSKARSGEFTFWVFDLWNDPGLTFAQRIQCLRERVAALPDAVKPYVKVVPQITAHNEAEVLALETQWRNEGYEGAIMRSPSAKYLNERSTMTDQAFMKLKRFFDAEARIIGFRPLDKKSPLAKSFVDAGDITSDDLNALSDQDQVLAGYRVKDITSGAEFNLGTGEMSFKQRQMMWRNREQLKDRIVKYKYFPVGMDEKTKVPRHPVYLGFREKFDMAAELKTAVDNSKPVDGNKKAVGEK